MKARAAEELPRGTGWVFELKLDGIRSIAVKDGPRVQLFSRLPRELTGEYPQVVDALRNLLVQQLVLDGELVALDAEGRSSFQLLQNRKRAPTQPHEIFFVAFDILNLNGRDLKGLPLDLRQQALAAVLKRAASPLKLSTPLKASVERLWKEVTRRGLEGVVAKQASSVYEPGCRSGAWVKVKSHREQEFVIGGYTHPEGSRKYFGALTIGYFSKRKLIFASRVGTGFAFEALRGLHHLFQDYRIPVCPFANLPAKRQGRYGQGITANEMKHCTWLRPELVCQVRFLEWTEDGSLRQPVFLGLRDDKKPSTVVREEAS